MGYETANAGFIRDAEAKNARFSLVTKPEFELKKNDDTGERERYFTASVSTAAPWNSQARRSVLRRSLPR
jgi:hypothetical protein